MGIRALDREHHLQPEADNGVAGPVENSRLRWYLLVAYVLLHPWRTPGQHDLLGFCRTVRAATGLFPAKAGITRFEPPFLASER